jgi:hypothetical protein
MRLADKERAELLHVNREMARRVWAEHAAATATTSLRVP